MTDDWLKQAEAVVSGVFMAVRPEIVAAHGNIDEELKGDNSPVTALDKKMERRLKEALTEFDASIPIIGEEYGGETNGSTFWLIDPIDGTESFIRGLPFVRNMLALVVNNEPVFTMVYKPISDELFVAHKNKGAYKNGQRLQVSSRPMTRIWIDIATGRFDGTGLAGALAAEVKSVKQIGDFTYMAQGSVDAFLNGPGGGPWDYAPRGLLLQEAGAKVTNIGSDTYDYRNGNFLAAHPDVFDQLMKIVTDKVAETDTSY